MQGASTGGENSPDYPARVGLGSLNPVIPPAPRGRAISHFIVPEIEPGPSQLDGYMDDINKTPLLNSEEERELGLRSGLAIAKRRPDGAGQPAPPRQSRSPLSPKGMDLLDLISEGNLPYASWRGSTPP